MINEPCVEPRHAVPFKRFEMLAHWMAFGVPCRRLYGSSHVASRGVNLSLLLEPGPRHGLVMVGPRCINLFLPYPWWGPSNNHMRVELVVGKHALPLRRFTQDQNQIGEIGNDLALCIENEVVCPIALCTGTTTQY